MHGHYPAGLGTPLRVNGRPCRWFSYADIETLALHYRRQVMRQGYQGIVALLRGGAHLATMLSQMTDIPYAVAYHDRGSDAVSLHQPPGASTGPRGKVLLVEDVAGKGRTLSNVKQFLLRQGYGVDVMVICWDELSRVVPDYGVRLPAGVRGLFPWERTQLAETDAHRRHGDADLAGWSTAFDMDGVFLQDLDPALYDTDLQGALLARDRLPALPLHPYWQDGDAIVSARLECDRDRTLDWLHGNGIRPSRLILRPSLDVPPAEFKARAIAELSITEFVESEADIADDIAARLPHVVVWHYDCATRQNRPAGRHAPAG